MACLIRMGGEDIFEVLREFSGGGRSFPAVTGYPVSISRRLA
jgi:hypothetical protein